MLNKGLKLMFFWISCLLLIGCSQEITLRDIDKLIFEDVKSASMNPDFLIQAVFLEENQINILRQAVQDGSELTDLVNENIPYYFQKGYASFELDRIDKKVIHLVYDLRSGYMYVPKVQVNEKKMAEYERRVSLYEKYLLGTYRFKPSSEIEKLIKSGYK